MQISQDGGGVVDPLYWIHSNLIYKPRFSSA